MSYAASLPPPPIGPTDSTRRITFFYVALGLIALALAVGYEARLLNSSAGKEAAQRIRGDVRVRGELGDDVHIPFAVGWSSGGQAVIYAYVTGGRAHAYAIVNLRALGASWMISGLEFHDPREGHLINLARPGVPAKPDQLHGSGSLYFVALGDSASGDVADLASFFEKQFGIPVKILAPMTLPPEAYDARRTQWVAEMLVQSMAAKYADIAADPDAKIVGILEDDLYIRGFNWPFTFNYRYLDKYSVVPAVRFDPAFDHFPPSPAIRMERLRKVAMKPVGLMYLGFRASEDPQSVDAFEGMIEDIDRMGNVYLASDVRTRASTLDTDGAPCLTFYSAEVAGAPLRKPIVPCWQQGDDSESTQFQIDLAHGKFQLTRNDLYRSGPVPLWLQRMNFSNHFDDKARAFGKSSWQSLDDTVWSADPNNIQTISIYGTQFERITPGNGFSPTAKYRAGPSNSAFSYALLSWENNGWRIDTRGGEVWKYLGCGPNTRVECYYMGHRGPAGDSIEIRRDPATGHIQGISQKTNADLPSAAAHDHTWTPRYDGDKIIEIDDSDGRTAHYRYDPEEYLTDVEADGHHVHYDYDRAHRIEGVIEDGRPVRIHYDSEGRPDRVDFSNGSSYGIRYSGETIEVNGPSSRYAVKILPSFFRTIEQK
jgi:predicted Zn-dependent protease